jgi:hypothetical protein
MGHTLLFTQSKQIVMDKTNRIEAVKKYFTVTPKKPDHIRNYLLLSLGGTGILLAMIGLEGFISWALGLISLYLAIKGGLSYLTLQGEYEKAYSKAEPKPTDAQLDKWLKNDKDMVLEEALKRLDIEYEDTANAPLIIDGPADKSKWIIGKDKLLRFSNHDILLFFLTEHHVATYKCELDLSSGAILNELSREFPYKDITNLETSTVNSFIQFSGDTKIEVHGTQRFSLFTSGGNQITIKYFFNKQASATTEYLLPPSDAENTIKTIRKRLKEYKDKFSTAGT